MTSRLPGYTTELINRTRSGLPKSKQSSRSSSQANTYGQKYEVVGQSNFKPQGQEIIQKKQLTGNLRKMQENLFGISRRASSMLVAKTENLREVQHPNQIQIVSVVFLRTPIETEPKLGLH